MLHLFLEPKAAAANAATESSVAKIVNNINVFRFLWTAKKQQWKEVNKQVFERSYVALNLCATEGGNNGNIEPEYSV